MVKLDISKDFNRVWHAILLDKRKSYVSLSAQVFGLLLSSLSNRQLPIVLDKTSLEEYAANTNVLHGSILGSAFFPLDSNNLPDDVICEIALCADDTTFYSKCYQASDL